jgi:hypothetical protein
MQCATAQKRQRKQSSSALRYRNLNKEINLQPQKISHIGQKHSMTLANERNMFLQNIMNQLTLLLSITTQKTQIFNMNEVKTSNVMSLICSILQWKCYVLPTQYEDIMHLNSINFNMSQHIQAVSQSSGTIIMAKLMKTEFMAPKSIPNTIHVCPCTYFIPQKFHYFDNFINTTTNS